jgi:hypothetical protein
MIMISTTIEPRTLRTLKNGTQRTLRNIGKAYRSPSVFSAACVCVLGVRGSVHRLDVDTFMRKDHEEGR